jgi:hypothetical protein
MSGFYRSREPQRFHKQETGPMGDVLYKENQKLLLQTTRSKMMPRLPMLSIT